MKKGGNAFDNMAANELAHVVSYNYAGIISDGKFMVYRLKSGETDALDYHEKAPIKASKDILVANGNVIPNYQSTAHCMLVFLELSPYYLKFINPKKVIQIIFVFSPNFFSSISMKTV